MATSNNIKVAIKVRPLIPRECRAHVGEQWAVEENSIVCLNPLPITTTTTYHFDHVFGKESRNRDVFEKIAYPVVLQSLEGFNGTIFAYGQTSSGKTHTMIGNEEDPGITVLAVRQLFEEIKSDRVFMIRAGYIEIYNEKVFDLLNDRALVKINQNGDNDVKLTNKETCVTDGEMILKMLNRGNKLRKAAQTNMNETSSRSHAIFRIIIESEDVNGSGPVQVSYLNLVDLAGSEKTNDALTSGVRLQEGKDINTSLLHLGMAIRALSEGQKFVDVRSSKLTRILQASLGGNANTAIVCNVTPAVLEETASTLNFASQAKTVKNDAICNKFFLPEEALMKQMQAEITHLKAELAKSQQSRENEKKLEADIARKEEIFLTGGTMRFKADRRKTWHHMSGSNNKPTGVSLRTASVGTPSGNAAPPRLDTPKELRKVMSLTPSPIKATLEYRLGEVERDYLTLQQFTQYEAYSGCDKNDNIETLKNDLKVAREEAIKYKNLFYTQRVEKMIESPQKDEKLPDSSDSNQLPAVEAQNAELVQQVAQLRSVYEERIQTAKKQQEKAEIAEAEIEITFQQYKKQSNQRINELQAKLESIKDQPVLKPVDLNISQMPIKVEPKISSELTELKYECDQLKLDRKSNKKRIEDLKSELEAVINEKNTLQTEHLKVVVQNKKTIEDMECQLKTVTEHNNALISDQLQTSERHGKIAKELSAQLNEVTEERNALQSECSRVSARNIKIIEDLESQLRKVTEERDNKPSEMSESSVDTINSLELQLKTIADEKDILERKYSEESTSNCNIIQDLKAQLETQTAEKNVLQSEHSEMSAQVMEYIEELDQIKSKFESLQQQYDSSCADVNRLQTIVDSNLQVIEKTEEECKTFKASLVEYYDKIKISMQESECLKAKEESARQEVVTLKNSLKTQSNEIDDLKQKMQEVEQQNYMLCAKQELFKPIEEYQEKHRTEIAKKEEDLKKLTELLESSTNNLQASIATLESELNVKEQQTNVFENDLKILQAELEKKWEEFANYEAIISDLKIESNRKMEVQFEELNAKLAAKQQALNKYEIMMSNQKSELKEELQKQLSDQKMELNEDLQRQLSHQQMKLNEEFQKQLSDQKVELVEDLQRKLSDQETALKGESEKLLSEQKSVLNEEFQKKLSKLRVEWDENKQQHVSAVKTEIMKKYEEQLLGLESKAQNQQEQTETIISDLRKEVSELKMKLKLLTQLSELKEELETKVAERDRTILEQSENFQRELLKLKSQLMEKQEDVDRNEVIITNLKSDLHEKENRALSAKNVIESLENQLRAHDEQRKSPSKSTKSNANADRKARRHSQHDESRMWLDDTVVPPATVAIQTDPSDANCSCESMDLEIKELNLTVAIKNSVINSLRMEMRNHPLIGENDDLKKKLEQQQAEAQLLRLDVEHYKDKAQKYRQCSCLSKKMESKEIQVDCDINSLSENDHSGVPEGPNAEDHSGVPNDQKDQKSYQGIPGQSKSSLYYYCHIVPIKLKEANVHIMKLNDEIKRLKKEMKALTVKTKLYRDLAVSRRAEVKRLLALQADPEAPVETSNG